MSEGNSTLAQVKREAAIRQEMQAEIDKRDKLIARLRKCAESRRRVICVIQRLLWRQDRELRELKKELRSGGIKRLR